MTDHTDEDDGEQFHFRSGIRPGDIVHDLAQPGWPRMRVITKEAETLEQYIQGGEKDLRTFEKNALAGAHADDAVYLATYLTDSPLKAQGTAYPVPASRIAKQDLDGLTHVGGDGYGPVHHPMDYALQAMLTAMLFHDMWGGNDGARIHGLALEAGVPEAVADEAWEVAQVKVDERQGDDDD